MKNHFVLTFFLCFLFVSCHQPKTVISTEQFSKETKQITLTNKRVLFLGNSITHNGLYVSFLEYALRKSYPNQEIDIISIGLGSETISGQSEINHPFPRPSVMERLDRALEAVNPDIIFSCYGMNDGIYHPSSKEGLIAYQKGIQTLIQKAKKINSELILVTPPPFDALPISHKVVNIDAPEFGYSTPFEGYDKVLGEYSDWLNTLNGNDITVIDWHTNINENLAKKRITDPTFTYAKDGVHPNEAGHLLMAQLLLEGLKETKSINYLADYQKIKTDSLFQTTHTNRVNRSERWRNAIGYTRGKTVKSISPKSLLILMGGQSNMSGLAQKANLLDVKFPKNIDFIDYGLTGNMQRMAERFGPEFGLAVQLNKTHPNQHFTFLKYSVGGASLLDWAPDYSKEKAEITGNAQFGNLYARFFQLIDSLQTQQAEIEPTAILWMQGERDARIPEAGKEYYENFKKLILACRKQIGQPDLPFIFGMVNPPADRYPALETVRNAQRQIAKDLPNIFIIETDDLAKLRDNLHYNTIGQWEMGKRFGVQLNQLLSDF